MFRKKRNKRKLQYKKRRPHESSFEPNVNWTDVRKFYIIDIIEVIVDQEYEIVDPVNLYDSLTKTSEVCPDKI